MTEDTETLFLLWAARETGVLDALLDDADTPAEVAEATGVTERAARLTVDSLAAMGFFKLVGDAYEPTNRALGFLAVADLRSVGRFPYELDELERLQRLPEVMQGATVRETDDETWNRLGHVQATDEATVRASVTVAQHAVPGSPSAERDGPARVLDFGGAPGTYAVEFARRGYEVTLADTGARLAESESLLAREPIETVAVDPAAESAADLPTVDCVFVPMRTHEFGRETNRALVSRAADTLADDGWLVLVDHLRDESPQATATTVRTLANGAGEAYGRDDYREWFDAAGLRSFQVRSVPGTGRQAVLGRR
ncbi:class I SAM-dependent methyltransferase [Haloarchaeobius sp. TZWWS8]|uniref:class I SAM-dependent methyltransferase n=1 Tax=Haloarchaeobius sp. TZWWS8 TaxID=3446121 RepID=UPI003EB714D1